MRKLFILFFAILAFTGLANAANIPQSEDPLNGPAVWTITVYNNSGSDMDVGDVVVWDIEQSTGDNDNYVTTTTTADTYIVAGVVFPNAISAADTGTIAIHGVVQVDAVTSSLGVVDGPACSSGTAGSARSCTTEAAAFGFVTQANTANSALIFVDK